MSDVAAIKAALAAQEIETPSWAYGNSGTRFKVFAQPGVPRTVKEKVDDAATVHRFTGVAPSVALLPPYPGVCAQRSPGDVQLTLSGYGRVWVRCLSLS
jgi:L-rhamnose isomerase/sugar isomerase